MSPEKRSALMSRIKGRDTGLERAVADSLRRHGLAWEAHRRDLPGCPDFVFHDARLAIFVDGDFWHGWRFPAWRNKLSEAWEAKLEGNVRRDKRSRRRLQRLGWAVIRLWEHQIERDLDSCIVKIMSKLAQHEAVKKRKKSKPIPPSHVWTRSTADTALRRSSLSFKRSASVERNV
jgi:DNA mismatch endonuclease (patch repair protein)